MLANAFVSPPAGERLMVSQAVPSFQGLFSSRATSPSGKDADRATDAELMRVDTEALGARRRLRGRP